MDRKEQAAEDGRQLRQHGSRQCHEARELESVEVRAQFDGSSGCRRGPCQRAGPSDTVRLLALHKVVNKLYFSVVKCFVTVSFLIHLSNFLRGIY